MEQKLIDRINELARKAKNEPLSEEELKEQAELRKQYIAAYKKSLVSQLESIRVVDEKGNKHKLNKKKK